MRLSNAFKVAWRGLLVNKARSLLTLLGIIIGIGAVITILALSGGLQAEANRQVNEMGANLLFVFPQMTEEERRQAHSSMRSIEFELFDRDDVAAMEKALSVPHGSTSLVNGQTVLRYGNETLTAETYGIDENYGEIFNFNVTAGREFTRGDIQAAEKAVILGSEAAEILFDDENPIGQKITVNGIRFNVIGVYEEKGGGLGNLPDQRAHVPLPVAQKRLFGAPDDIHMVTFGLDDIKDMDTAKEEITDLLLKRRRIQDDSEENFAIMSQQDALESFGSILGVMTGVLGGIAAVSLLVGGIGIMNIMLVSVTERTREIGLRKAVGARKVDILLQFLIEAIVLCCIGGALGIALGYAGAIGLSSLIRSSAPEAAWDPHISGYSIIIAIAFSSLIGIIFGVYPATSAANKDPIDALRYE